eukprot:750777-Pyramimonas_sp.AAC.1
MYSPAAPSPASSRYGTVIVRLQCSYNTGYSTHATVHVQSSGARNIPGVTSVTPPPVGVPRWPSTRGCSWATCLPSRSSACPR